MSLPREDFRSYIDDVPLDATGGRSLPNFPGGGACMYILVDSFVGPAFDRTVATLTLRAAVPVAGYSSSVLGSVSNIPVRRIRISYLHMRVWVRKTLWIQ